MNKKNITKIITLVILVLFFTTNIFMATGTIFVEKSPTSTLNGDFMYVGGSGPGNYTTIQDAIDNASNGDIVFVFDDSSPYYDNISINKSITLLGENKDTTILDGNASGNVINVLADRVNISGFTIQNSGNDDDPNGHSGIYVNNFDYIIISENKIINNYNGLSLSTTESNIILNNTIVNNQYHGIIISGHSVDNRISNNYISQSNNGIGEYHSGGYYLTNNTINKNTITSNSDGIRLDQVIGNTISENSILSNTAYGILIYSYSHYNNIENNTIAHNNNNGQGPYAGIYTTLSSYENNIINNHLEDNGNGIHLGGWRKNKIINNTLIDNTGTEDRYGAGIFVESDDNTISKNLISGNRNGIYIYSGWHDSVEGNTIKENYISENNRGIFLESEYSEAIIKDNKIFNNTITRHNGYVEYGLYISRHDGGSCDSNDIYHNNFIDNSMNAYDNGNNLWDNGYPSGGNYWDDYNGNDTDGDDIGDSPYSITGGNNQDRYPFIYPDGWKPNHPPLEPTSPDPENGETDVDIDIDLSWTGGDPNLYDIVTYDIFFGEDSSPPKVESNQTETSYNPGIIWYNQTYYWQIVAWDNHGVFTEGSVWSFTTKANSPPNTPYDPNPENGAIDVSIDTDLSWTGGDPNPGDTVTYDVYFGTDSPPTSKVSDNQSDTIYNSGTLEYDTMYYWKIVAWDNHGASTTGSIWEFTTEEEPQEPELEITEVKGGFGKISVVIENIGEVDASDVDWSISVIGGILGRINTTTEGTIATLNVGDTQTVQTDKFIFGLGYVNITIEATYAETWAGTAFVFGPFILRVNDV